MPSTSAGLLLYRRRSGSLELLLVHPGGPFWSRRDTGAWSIPKGEYDAGDPLAAACREFEEETGFSVEGPFEPLTPVKLKSGKIVRAWACEGDIDADSIRSNTFTMEWPPRSGVICTFPEVDRAAWFPTQEAARRLHPSQAPWVAELVARLAGRGTGPA